MATTQVCRVEREGTLTSAETILKRDFLIDSMKSGGDVSGMSSIWPKLGQLTRFGLKTCLKPIFLSFITVKVDLELKNCENVKKFQKRFGP